MRAVIFALTTLTTLTLAAPAAAQVSDYETCLALVEQAPERAREEAERWGRFGGGAAAEHCAALALATLGAPQAAADKLLGLGLGANALTAAERVAVLEQAASLWREAGDPATAKTTLDRAISLAPAQAGLYEARARARAALEDWPAAKADLDEAIALAPDRAEAHALRAAALRRLGQSAAALADAKTATALDPGLALGWLERGAAERAFGRNDAARENWLTAIRLDPAGPVGAIARARLQASRP